MGREFYGFERYPDVDKPSYFPPERRWIEAFYPHKLAAMWQSTQEDVMRRHVGERVDPRLETLLVKTIEGVTKHVRRQSEGSTVERAKRFFREKNEKGEYLVWEAGVSKYGQEQLSVTLGSYHTDGSRRSGAIFSGYVFYGNKSGFWLNAIREQSWDSMNTIFVHNFYRNMQRQGDEFLPSAFMERVLERPQIHIGLNDPDRQRLLKRYKPEMYLTSEGVEWCKWDLARAAAAVLFMSEVPMRQESESLYLGYTYRFMPLFRRLRSLPGTEGEQNEAWQAMKVVEVLQRGSSNPWHHFSRP